MTIALLDSGPLSLVTHPRTNPENTRCKAWLSAFLAAGNFVLVPEITYYEVRRELRRSELKNGGPSRGLANLEAFVFQAGLVPITSPIMLLASDFWAEARHKHIQGAPDAALDADLILCAQARHLDPVFWTGHTAPVVIATTNVNHLTHFADARHWQTIS